MDAGQGCGERQEKGCVTEKVISIAKVKSKRFNIRQPRTKCGKKCTGKCKCVIGKNINTSHLPLSFKGNELKKMIALTRSESDNGLDVTSRFSSWVTKSMTGNGSMKAVEDISACMIAIYIQIERRNNKIRYNTLYLWT